ncbi:hypothetical protein [Nonomuraea indica]|uniref:Protein-tyrosine-phosphatase n=1 Tax=Nonomuraea indica TaxID=1581193 RepID=A0ABW8AEF3_9ACTN
MPPRRRRPGGAWRPRVPWQLDDPAGQGVEAVRAIRDDIRSRVSRLLSEPLPG